jgi:flagellar biosynthesis protein FliQ
MGPDQVADLMRQLLREAMLLSAPVLLVAAATSFLLSLLQTLTSLQDQTLSTVPRLLVVVTLLFAGAPWLLRHLVGYTLALFTDFHRYLGEP